MSEIVIFYTLSALLSVSSIMVVTRKNPITAAIYLVGSLFLIACLYALLGAHFAAAIQVLVYAGAIMVLFLFVIMLLNLDPESLQGPALPVSEIAVLLLTVVGFSIIGVNLLSDAPMRLTGEFTEKAIEAAGGNTRVVGMKLFVTYLWPFELASFLILLAIVASVVIARKPKKGEGVKAS